MSAIFGVKGTFSDAPDGEHIIYTSTSVDGADVVIVVTEETFRETLLKAVDFMEARMLRRAEAEVAALPAANDLRKTG